MTSITFDTLKFVEKLKHSGINDKQAKAISEAFRDAHSEMEAATKRDLKELQYQMILQLSAIFTLITSFHAVLEKIL